MGAATWSAGTEERMDRMAPTKKILELVDANGDEGFFMIERRKFSDFVVILLPVLVEGAWLFCSSFVVLRVVQYVERKPERWLNGKAVSQTSFSIAGDERVSFRNFRSVGMTSYLLPNNLPKSLP